ncbi:heat-inducible transcriptional repressor HrcA [Sulfobacillus harzensis]|uniref:Heat-inducible transcription repressor HrcA n=1 Tax=Sulfobacillus harzensis TaxID=2729629 RepID=A0A7Y0Q337_9FIRM|nr:heat-inducible transcriptional repressor HrcA [Sulfobacillus harzensis]NMP23000.1 heat-inducible transcription repressor HrcA [Sulfobacillus harzensis]
MDGRKRRVLEVLIDDYIATAEPVGSRTLAKKYDLGVGPATIRNEMADLEDLGFLEQPHTSAGRIPSDKGYRFYVDEIIHPAPLQEMERDRIRRAYQVRVRELHWFIHQTARLVSELTQYPSLVAAPPVKQAQLRDLSFVPLGRGTVLMVLQTTGGLVENQTFILPDDFDAEQLSALAEDFTREFRGVSMEELKNRILDPLQGDINRYQGLWQLALKWVTGQDGDEDKVSLAGPLNILNYPEFRDVDKVRRVLGFLEKETALELVSRTESEGVQVVIGAESLMDDIQDCSLVTATYRVGGNVVGHLMVLGPRRMQYARVMSIVDAVSNELTRVLHG